MSQDFVTWMAAALDLKPAEVRLLSLGPVLERYATRLIAANGHGATDPLTVISRAAAGGNSRAANKRILDGLGYEDYQRAAIHRLLADRSNDRPGLLRSFAKGRSLSRDERRYALRRVRIILYGPEGRRRTARPRHRIVTALA